MCIGAYKICQVHYASVVHESPIIDMTLDEKIDISIAHCKGKQSCTLHPLYNLLFMSILTHIIVLLFPVESYPFSNLFQISCQIQIGRQR